MEDCCRDCPRRRRRVCEKRSALACRSNSKFCDLVGGRDFTCRLCAGRGRTSSAETFVEERPYPRETALLASEGKNSSSHLADSNTAGAYLVSTECRSGIDAFSLSIVIVPGRSEKPGFARRGFHTLRATPEGSPGMRLHGRLRYSRWVRSRNRRGPLIFTGAESRDRRSDWTRSERFENQGPRDLS
jgi:hypothetical protein